MSRVNLFVFRSLLLLALAGLTGCRTTDEGRSGQMASVEISGHTPAQIRRATAAAFVARGYVKADSQADTLIFEKPGTAWETAKYGGWSSDRVWVRLRAGIMPAPAAGFILSCDAFVVTGHGDAGMEMERKYWFAKRTECKAILDAVKAALAAPADPTDGPPRSPP